MDIAYMVFLRSSQPHIINK